MIYKSIRSKEIFLKEIGVNIRKWRIIKNVKLEQLAITIGLSKGMLSLIENGRTNTTLSRLYDIAKALNISEMLLLNENHYLNL